MMFSPEQFNTADAAKVERPTLLAYHSFDAAIFFEPNQQFVALTSAPAKERVSITGGNNANCGHHLFNGMDAEFMATVAAFIGRYNAMLSAPPAALRREVSRPLPSTLDARQHPDSRDVS